MLYYLSYLCNFLGNKTIKFEEEKRKFVVIQIIMMKNLKDFEQMQMMFYLKDIVVK